LIKTYRFFGALFALFFFVFLGFGHFTVADSAFAGDYVTSYSNVLDDLKTDQNFNESDYCVDNSDYGLYVITIGESENSELFLYVYQPCFVKNFRATSINMNVSQDAVEPHLYNLQFINKVGTLYKYKVTNFVVPESDVRYYEIYSIYRRYDSSIDPESPYPSQTINEVSYNVSKKWAVSSVNNIYTVECFEVEVITVTDMFVGFVRYDDGYFLYPHEGACDSHFVAFSTDKPIERLIDADVAFTYQSYHRETMNVYPYETVSYGNVSSDEVTVSGERVPYHGSGLFAYHFSWNRIESASDFVDHTELSNIYSGALLNVNLATRIDAEAKQSILNLDWVLRFTETSYSYDMVSSFNPSSQTHDLATFENQTLVGNVTILRLYFETDGFFYNLGTVCNKQTGSDKPINSGSHIEVDVKNPFDSFNPDDDWMKYIIAAVVVIFSVLLIVLIIKIVDKIPKKTKTVVSFSRPKKKKHKRGKKHG